MIEHDEAQPRHVHGIIRVRLFRQRLFHVQQTENLLMKAEAYRHHHGGERQLNRKRKRYRAADFPIFSGTEQLGDINGKKQ